MENVALTAEEVREVRALLAERRDLAAERARRDATWPQRMQAMLDGISSSRQAPIQSAPNANGIA